MKLVAEATLLPIIVIVLCGATTIARKCGIIFARAASTDDNTVDQNSARKPSPRPATNSGITPIADQWKQRERLDS